MRKRSVRSVAVKVLGIDVDDALVGKWVDWYAPPVQPFFVESTRGLPKSLDGAFTPETRDSFKAWSPANRGKKVVWYDEATARDAGLAFRRATAEDVVAFAEADGLPNAGEHELVGFAQGSGPNCFGTVMAAAGVNGAQNEWMRIAPFDEWLTSVCRRRGADEDAGTVLLWRDTSTGDPFHAAITLGDGWALEKASQCWWSPRYVTTVANVKGSTRMNGIRLERWHVVDA